MKQLICQFSWMVGFWVLVMVPRQPALAQEPAIQPAPASVERVPDTIEALFGDIDEKSLLSAPKREYAIDKGATKKVRLFLADPKLLESKFQAALVLLAVSPSDNLTRRQMFELEGIAVRESHSIATRVIEHHSGSFYFSGAHSAVNTRNCPKTRSEYFKLLADHCPKHELPEQAVLEYLISPGCDRDVHFSLSEYERRQAWNFDVYAPSEELIQQRVKAIIQLVDSGLCRPLQRECLAEGQKSLQAARKSYLEVAKVNEDIRVEEEKLAKPTEITSDILTQLKAQKISLAIELAGLNARLKACNEMLMRADGRNSIRSVGDAINDAKVKAEIELAGIKEKLDQTNKFIGEGDKRAAIRVLVSEMKNQRSAFRSKSRSDQRLAETYIRLVSLYTPLEVKDNKITISPIEWTN